MGHLWSGAYPDFESSAIACFEGGLVWEGPYPGFQSEAIACYGSGLIWSGPYRGFRSEAIGSYDRESVWNGAYKGFSSEAVGCYDGESIWEGAYQGFSSEAVGCYQGSPPGAIAAALVLLLGGGEQSDSDSSDSDSNSSDGDDEPSESDEDDSYADDDDSDSYDYSSDDDYVPPPEPPEEIAERSLAAATTIARVLALKAQYSQTIPAKTLDKLVEPHLKRAAAAQLDAMLPELEGRSAAQLESVFDEELRRRAGTRSANEFTDWDSYKRYTLAVDIERMEKESFGQVELLARMFLVEHPHLYVLANRRLVRMREEKAAEDLRQIEPLEKASNRQIQAFFLEHKFTNVAEAAIARVCDKYYLLWLCQQGTSNLVPAAQKRYLEILDAEHEKRSWLDKIHYNLFFRDRERKFGGW